MRKKTKTRVSVLTAFLLAFAMLSTALVLSAGNGKARAFADGEQQGELLYIVDVGRVNDQNSKQLHYGYGADKTPTYIAKANTFIKRSGGTFGHETEFEGKPLTTLWNAHTDHPFGEDPTTHKYWGFNADYSTDMPHRMGRGGNFTGGYSEFRSVNDDTVTNERLIYKFEVPANTALDVNVITHSPGGTGDADNQSPNLPTNWGDVNGTMSVNNGATLPLRANDSDQMIPVPGCEGVLNSEDNKYYLTLTFGVDGAKTVVCGIIIRTRPYTVTYTLNGGLNAAQNKDSYTYGNGFTLAAPTRTGHTFNGWYDKASGNAVTEISNTQTGDISVYASWTPATYAVTYNLDGGTNDAANVATYTYGTGLTLANPTRTGYTFDGWYDAQSGGNKVTAISDTQTGDVTLYARWTQNAGTGTGTGAGDSSSNNTPPQEDTAKSGCNSSIGGTASLIFGGLLLLSAGAVVIFKCKKKN